MRQLTACTGMVLLCLALAGPVLAQQNDPVSGQQPAGRESASAGGDGLPRDFHEPEFGGRIQFDWTSSLEADDRLRDILGDPEDGAEFRRARLYAEGDVTSWLSYKLQLEFVRGPQLRDVYLRFHDLGGFPNAPLSGRIVPHPTKHPCQSPDSGSSGDPRAHRPGRVGFGGSGRQAARQGVAMVSCRGRQRRCRWRNGRGSGKSR